MAINKDTLQELVGDIADIEQKLDDLAPVRSTTTANGIIGGTTVIDNTRTEANNYWNGQMLLITSGAYRGQIREIVTWNLAASTFTVSPAFGGQILAGVTYKVLADLAADIETTEILARIGDPTAHTLASLTAKFGDNLQSLWTILGYEGATSLHDKLTAARAAFLDAAISSRAVPGDQMALTPAERLVVQALILSDATPFAGANIALVKAQTDKIPLVQHETEWATTAVVQNVANAAATNLTAGSITPTFPTGATRVRAILIASIHVANQGANTHHISLKVQGQKAVGGYTDLLDLTAATTLGLAALDGVSDAYCVAIDVTAKVDASAVQYDFRFVVDSDNAGSVNYTTGFVLVLVYTI